MKVFVVFTIISICFVNSEEEFGQRISKVVSKTNSTDSESIKSKKTDLDTHESIRTYEYALAPIEVQTHYPKVIAEEHTLHELPALTSGLRPSLPMNEAIILTDDSDNYGSTSKSLYGAQRIPKHYGSELPLYRDDPKDQLQSYSHLKPALPMQAFSQVKADTSDEEYTIHAQPISISREVPYSSAPVKQNGLTGYSTNLDQHIRPMLESYGLSELKKLQPLYSARSLHARHSHNSHLDYIPGIPGKPWKDYPIYSSPPYTNFKCQPHQPGFFADIEAGCQVWHYCQLDGRHDHFMCANGTLFNQKTRVCDWWYNVDCHSSVLKYGINADLYREPTHKKYLETTYNPINKYGIPLKQHIPVPLNYHSIDSEYNTGGHGLVFAESQNVPQKLIKRVRKVKSNNQSNSTESGLNNTKIAE